MSDDALLEEYSVARASFDLSMTDLMVCTPHIHAAVRFDHKTDHIVHVLRKSQEIQFFSLVLKNPSKKSTSGKIIEKVLLTVTKGLLTCPSFGPNFGLSTWLLSICFVS
jgi:hypothetical protein